MAGNTNITLENHFATLINRLIETGRYNSVSDVIKAGLILLEENEAKVNLLRSSLEEGEQSGFVEYSYEKLIKSLDQENT